MHDRFLAQVAAATQPLVDATTIMRTTARMLAEYLDVDRCAYAEVENEEIFVIHGDHPRNGVKSIVGRWPVAAFGAACTQAMLSGEPYTVVDATTDPRLSAEDRTAYEATQIVAVICLPLHKDGKFTAAMAVHQKTPREWTADERVLVQTVVARCWESLERCRSEQRYRGIVEASPECVVVIGRDGTVQQINAAGLRTLEGEVKNFYDVVAPECRDAFRKHNERVCSGEPSTLTFDVIGLGGTRRTLEANAVPLTGSNLSVTRDVTQVARNRARVDYAVRASGIGFWYCDLPFSELIWDERVKEHFFFPPDARVTIESFYAHIHPEDRDLVRAAVKRSIEAHQSYDTIYRTLDPETGATKYIRALGGTQYQDGRPTHFDGVTIDVTAQLLDQDRLARVARAALTVHAAGTRESVLRVVTEEARSIIGAQRAVASYDGVEVISALGDDASTGASSSVPFLGRDGRTRGALTVHRKRDVAFTQADESVLIQLAQIAQVALENARLYDQLREQDRAKDEFLAVLAHELRNPLAPIATGLQVMRMTDDHQKTAHMVEVMQRQLGHLVRMVDDLLDISRITRGKVTLKKERVHAKDVLASAIETARPALEAKQHELAVHISPAAMVLEADPTRLSQVVSNLLQNAAKYSPKGSRMTLDAHAQSGWLVLTLQDNGYGIASEMLPRVFEMFAQVNSDTGGGLGIGLTLARRLVELHGGTIRAESEGIDKGSTFIVRLPLARETREATPSKQEDKNMGQGLRILVVDDNVDAAESLSLLLELSGHQTRLAHTGTSAIPTAVGFRPHVVLLDIGLPGLDGYEVARRLRAEASLPQPVLVALTGWGTEEDRRQASLAGFDQHLVKPVDGAQLASVLRSVHPARA
jgi:signal transduction histidine kinase/ActR/RegA family two-component response regulator